MSKQLGLEILIVETLIVRDFDTHPTKLNSGDGLKKSTLDNSRIPISRRIARNSIIFYKVRNLKDNLGLLGVNELNSLGTL